MLEEIYERLHVLRTNVTIDYAVVERSSTPSKPVPFPEEDFFPELRRANCGGYPAGLTPITRTSTVRATGARRWRLCICFACTERFKAPPRDSIPT